VLVEGLATLKEGRTRSSRRSPVVLQQVVGCSQADLVKDMVGLIVPLPRLRLMQLVASPTSNSNSNNSNNSNNSHRHKYSKLRNNTEAASGALQEEVEGPAEGQGAILATCLAQWGKMLKPTAHMLRRTTSSEDEDSQIKPREAIPMAKACRQLALRPTGLPTSRACPSTRDRRHQVDGSDGGNDFDSRIY
jgi:hypothetical protein